MAGYTRQSTLSPGDTILDTLFDNEYDQLVSAFSSSTGHKHDGTAAEGPVIALIGDAGLITPLNKIVVDTNNNRVGVFVNVSSAAVEQIRVSDGLIAPVTDNDIDLGSASLKFKDLYIDGIAYIDSLTLTSGATVTAILDEDAMGSDSATALATQQSIKAYVDAQVVSANALDGALLQGNATLGTDIVVTAGDVITVDTINETTSAAGVTVDGVLLKDSTITGSVIGGLTTTGGSLIVTAGDTFTTDTISETTAAAGVTIDGVLLKDSQITLDVINELTPDTGVTIDGTTIKDGGVVGLAIGTDVLAYDANLASFVSVFTLPTSDGTSGQAITTNASGTLGFSDLFSSPGDHVVIVHTGNGHGSSTGTKIRRFSTTLESTGSAIVYADSSTAGATFTIQSGHTGLYAITYSDKRNAGFYMGISVNSAQLTTNVESITVATRRSITNSFDASGAYLESSPVIYLAAGDVVRAHTDGTPNDTSNLVYFSIRKVVAL